jgi:hypothetical protein
MVAPGARVNRNFHGGSLPARQNPAGRLVGNWRGRKVTKIRRGDVRRMLDRIVERGTPIAANRVHDIARKLFNWCLEQEIIDASPCAGLKAPPERKTPATAS